LKNPILKIVLVPAGLAASLGLAFFGYSFYAGSGIRTPGILLAEAIFPARHSAGEFAAGLGQTLRLQMFVDWVFWFAVMWLLYLLFARLGRKSGEPR